MKRTLLIMFLTAGIGLAKAQVFNETFGTATASAKIEDYKGFSNAGKLTFSGNAEIQSQASSAGKYANASGGANVRIANVTETNITVSGINTSAVKQPVIGFAILKGPNSSNGSELAVEYSLDGGKAWTGVKFPPLPTGEGTGLVWNYRETAPIPQASNLVLRFRQTGNFVVFRLDDISILSKQ
jgi:hypothetical protein